MLYCLFYFFCIKFIFSDKAMTKIFFTFYLFFLCTLCICNGTIDYYKDIYPIIQNKCYNCHHPNGYSTLVLDSYQSVKNYSKTIQYVINNNIMPPWKADSSYMHFSNERFLTSAERAKINLWVKTKCKEGKITDKQKITTVQYSGKSRVNRKPDLTLHFPEKIIIKNELKDMFVYIKIPFELKNDTILDCIEFLPDNIKYLHHLNFKIIALDSSVNPYEGKNVFVSFRDNIAEQSKKEIYKALNLLNKNNEIPKESYYGSWVPGMSALDLKNTPLGVKMPKKGVLLISVLHYAPSSENTTDSSSFNLYFKKLTDLEKTRTVDHLVVGVGSEAEKSKDIPSLLLIIKPDKKQWFHYKYMVKDDFTIINMNPHMHLLGKKFYAYAIYDNDTTPLIKIENWDFDWQELYYLKKPMVLKKGTVICLDGYYDNTTENPKNPFSPPRLVSGDDGMQTSGEMMLLIFQGFPYLKDDENMQFKTQY